MSKRLTLLTLTLRNFKGVKEFSLMAAGGNVKVFGDNATGKTTLFDAFVWLLFDKDSQNKKDFSLKTLADGKELHGLDHEVEGQFFLDGKQLSLKKVYSEKWTKKRGSATAEFSGHTTDYFIDGVPSKLKEYKALVDSIVQEDVFKLLTSPSFFNDQLKWQDRRKTLLEICGDISDEDVIDSNPELAALPTILQARKLEDHRKIIAARRAEINKELDRIPVRISEVQRGIPDLSDVDKISLEAEVKKLNAEIDDLMTQISSIKNGKAISDKQKEIQQIEIALLEIKRDHDAGAKDTIYQLRARIQEEKSNLSILQSKVSNITSSKRHNDENIKSIDTQLSLLRDEWHEINNQVFTHNSECECPSCGQALPEEQVSAAREKALEQFNLEKARKLEGIDARGKQAKARKESLNSDNEKLKKDYEKLGSQVTEKEEVLGKLETQLEQQESLVTDVLDNPAYVEKLKEKQTLEEGIKQVQELAEESVKDIQIEIMKLRDKRDEVQGQIGEFSVVEQAKARITELSEQERELAAEFESIEHELYLADQFIRTKVDLLEEKINSRFKYARFKLFETQINGGLTEVCETTYKGVPYSSGLNNAAKINVGLDIINTLSEHYGFFAPIFIDNSEAVTKLIDTKSQTVSLVVSEQDKQLRVEVDPEDMKEAI
ncbi:AAA family ATPase [Bacillus mesophilum]|uniref:AAA family ATPase n=1 Tax=Bacillus mesophilum TaxID=1071718 RepID=A0A7V7RPF1_9BACI|nr:AAA family ATPase [Bacillus mesophilum]KAB2335053.1 AAA family ATPase [Bacillus mesophilum]